MRLHFEFISPALSPPRSGFVQPGGQPDAPVHAFYLASVGPAPVTFVRRRDESLEISPSVRIGHGIRRGSRLLVRFSRSLKSHLSTIKPATKPANSEQQRGKRGKSSLLRRGSSPSYAEFVSHSHQIDQRLCRFPRSGGIVFMGTQTGKEAVGCSFIRPADRGGLAGQATMIAHPGAPGAGGRYGGAAAERGNRPARR
jgi:hypothetical protein